MGEIGRRTRRGNEQTSCVIKMCKQSPNYDMKKTMKLLHFMILLVLLFSAWDHHDDDIIRNNFLL